MKRTSLLLLTTLVVAMLTVAASSVLAAGSGPHSVRPVGLAAEGTGTPTLQPGPTNTPGPLGSTAVIQMGGNGRVTVVNNYPAAVTLTIEGKTYTVPANAKDFQIELGPGTYAWSAVVPGVAQGSSRFVVSTAWNTTLSFDPVVPRTLSPTPAVAKPGSDNPVIVELSRQIDLDPKNAAAYRDRGLAYLQLGYYDLALADLNTYLKLAPEAADRALVDKALAETTLALTPTATAVALAATPGVSPAAATPTLTPTRIVTATVTPATETSLVLADDYSAATCALSSVEDDEHKFGCENGVYSMLSKKGELFWRQAYRGTYDDVVVEVDARAPTGDMGVDYGIVFRAASTGGLYYFFSVGPDGQYSLYHHGADTGWKALLPYSQSDAIKRGAEWNRLKVVAQGSQIALYANDQFLDGVTDTKLISGTIGFAMQTDNPNGLATFDNLRVQKINRPLTLPAPKQRPPTPTPMPTIPAGMGGVLITNWYGQEMNIDLAGKLYKIPGNGNTIVHLAPGKYNWSADIPGQGRAGGTIEVVAGRYTPLSFAAR